MNPIADLLTRAKARALAHPCKGAAARDAYGDETFAKSTNAVRWCSYAATEVEASNNDEFNAACDALQRAAKRLPSVGDFHGVAILNDERPDLIPQMFDLAIEEASR